MVSTFQRGALRLGFIETPDIRKSASAWRLVIELHRQAKDELIAALSSDRFLPDAVHFAVEQLGRKA